VQSAIVKIVAEWFPEPDGAVRRVNEGQGVFPECLVNDVSVLVIWGSSGGATADAAQRLRSFREKVGQGIAIAAGPDGGDGWLRVDTSLAGERRVEAAFAAAVVKKAWGWDESESIRIDDDVGCLTISVAFDQTSACFRAAVVVFTGGDPNSPALSSGRGHA
jgi:hypothetical protein